MGQQSVQAKEVYYTSIRRKESLLKYRFKMLGMALKKLNRITLNDGIISDSAFNLILNEMDQYYEYYITYYITILCHVFKTFALLEKR